jgi:drug/metabolite transporter (DMT)-like permease
MTQMTRRTDLARLVTLAAIWGASFLFMRVAAPAFGAPATAGLRMLIAGTALRLTSSGRASIRNGAAETLSPAMLAGAALVIAGTALVLRG